MKPGDQAEEEVGDQAEEEVEAVPQDVPEASEGGHLSIPAEAESSSSEASAEENGDGSGSFDITSEPPEDERVEVSELKPNTPEWAEIVKPVTKAILQILAAVILLPFFFSLLPEAKMQLAIDWAKTALAPMVGFAGAVVGYYFGSRQT